MQQFHHDENLDFLKEQIKDIKVALFKTELNPSLKLPNNIIQTFKVEDDGTVWFFTSCNAANTNHIDEPFYAYLSYQKKGHRCHLQLSGKATLVKQHDEGLFSISNYARGSYGKLVLIKMKIMHAEFYENRIAENISWTEKLKQSFSQLFMPAAHRMYNFRG